MSFIPYKQQWIAEESPLFIAYYYWSCNDFGIFLYVANNKTK